MVGDVLWEGNQFTCILCLYSSALFLFVGLLLQGVANWIETGRTNDVEKAKRANMENPGFSHSDILVRPCCGTTHT